MISYKTRCCVTFGAIGRSSTSSPIHFHLPTPSPIEQLALDQEEQDEDEDPLLWAPLMLVSDFEIDTDQKDWTVVPLLPSRFGPIRPPTPPLTRGQDEDNPIYISSTDSSDTDKD